MQVTWKDGRLAARQLFDALLACGIDPGQQRFDNLFDRRSIRAVVRDCRKSVREGWIVVGMGRKVQEELQRQRVPHVPLTHPAARGTIRRKENYIAHVRARLLHNVMSVEDSNVAG